MKVNLFIVALLAVSSFSFAQTKPGMTVLPSTTMYVMPSTLVYNTGSLKTKGTGKYDIKGNFMVVMTTSADSIRTVDATGKTDMLTGGNIVLRWNEPGNPLSTSYGQLYISGIPQTQITGIVDKEFESPKHGSYQQFSLPFYSARLDSVSNQLGAGLTFSSAARYSGSGALYWNNTNVVAESIVKPSAQFTDGTTYFMLGTASLTPTTLHTLRGVPYAEVGTKTLSGAGATFGKSYGTNLNKYGEAYKTYVQDFFSMPTNAVTDTFAISGYGQNIYQFGNPYLTNLDLSQIGTTEAAGGTTTDGNAIGSLQGIIVNPKAGSVSSTSSGTLISSSPPLVVTFTNGVTVGDKDSLIVKPNQTFILKLNGTSSLETLNFNTLRRFASTARAASTPYSVVANAMPKLLKSSVSSNNSVKQLGVYALDANENYIGKTFLVVYPTASTGVPVAASTEFRGTLSNPAIATYEEDPAKGGINPNISTLLYINEVNDAFAGKPVAMTLNDNIKYLRFDLAENANSVGSGQTIGEGFYYTDANGDSHSIVQGQTDAVTIPANSTIFNLFYGEPLTSTTGVINDSEGTTTINYSKTDDMYKVNFASSWKDASIKVVDMNGRLFLAKSKISTNEVYEIPMENQNTGVYIVTVTSNTGQRVIAKIIR